MTEQIHFKVHKVGGFFSPRPWKWEISGGRLEYSSSRTWTRRGAMREAQGLSSILLNLTQITAAFQESQRSVAVETFQKVEQGRQSRPYDQDEE